MRLRPRHGLPLLAASLLFSLAPPEARAADGTFDKTFTVSGAVDLHAQTHSGNITVHTGGAGSVLIHATIQVRRSDTSEADSIIRELQSNPPLEQAGNTIRIRNIDEDLRRRVSVSYEITTPAETTADAQTGSGNIGIDGIRGPVEANTGSGNIGIAHVSGATRTNTGSGNIELSSIGASSRAGTGSGNIVARGVSGDFSGRTGSGNVIVDQTSGGNVEMNSGSGNLEARGVHGSLNASTGSGGVTAEGEMTANWSLRTSSGSVHVRLPSEAAFTVEARSSSGSIEISHPLTVQGRIGRREVRGTVRGGGALLAVSTSSGSIRID
jgi:DUF4097 and DUF4098 domain-containing protein YvlB